MFLISSHVFLSTIIYGIDGGRETPYADAGYDPDAGNVPRVGYASCTGTLLV